MAALRRAAATKELGWIFCSSHLVGSQAGMLPKGERSDDGATCRRQPSATRPITITHTWENMGMAAIIRPLAQFVEQRVTMVQRSFARGRSEACNIYGLSAAADSRATWSTRILGWVLLGRPSPSRRWRWIGVGICSRPRACRSNLRVPSVSRTPSSWQRVSLERRSGRRSGSSAAPGRSEWRAGRFVHSSHAMLDHLQAAFLPPRSVLGAYADDVALVTECLCRAGLPPSPPRRRSKYRDVASLPHTPQ